ncbi:MAG TPA: caspase family protein [Bradyrhizobium sp.]|uniref:caspase family protein n=1 Tax=Bradyrhizobium sp. TaxID=376 RepID=UPI002CF26E26|nr:caspase family protein [Bradyrhizobium sp.]HLZ02799.1 caspase family protein [Bradyrhizobium sp.]
MSAARLLILLIFASWLACGPAQAEQRVALVIGNSAYKNVPRLANPAHDAVLVADMFRKAGFDAVITKFDLDANGMRKALREFGARAQEADIAVIYYAGHGMELDGNNYLVPTDATLQTDADVLDETVPMDRVLFAVEPAKQLRLIILDACRDNPFAKTMKRTVASRGIGRGLAKVELNTPNTMIAFAAKAGSTASDGDSQNGPFATALVHYLPKPGLDLRLAFGDVRDEVLKNTGYQQEPYVYGSLGGDKVSLVPAKPVDVAPKPDPRQAIRKDYELTLQLGTREAWNIFIAHYPDGFYADLARVQLDKIAAEEAHAAAEERARLAEQEKARLAAEGAKKAEQERAVAEARAAEQARAAAEEARQIEQAKAEAAEQARAAAEKAAAADKAAAEKAEAAKKDTEQAASQKAAAELAAKQPADKQAQESTPRQKEDQAQKVAALPPPAQAVTPPSAAEIAKSIQQELRRVGCFTDAADGEWNNASQHSMTLFNKYAGTGFNVKLASVDALDAIKAKPSRVCPLVCDHGFKAKADRCVRITCPSGYRVNDHNECEVQKKRPVTTENNSRPKRELESNAASPATSKPQASGQIFCGRSGCRPVGPGCKLVDNSAANGWGGLPLYSTREVCH